MPTGTGRSGPAMGVASVGGSTACLPWSRLREAVEGGLARSSREVLVRSSCPQVLGRLGRQGNRIPSKPVLAGSARLVLGCLILSTMLIPVGPVSLAAVVELLIVSLFFPSRGGASSACVVALGCSVPAVMCLLAFVQVRSWYWHAGEDASVECFLASSTPPPHPSPLHR